jgi:hypothetical protein
MDDAFEQSQIDRASGEGMHDPDLWQDPAECQHHGRVDTTTWVVRCRDCGVMLMDLDTFTVRPTNHEFNAWLNHIGVQLSDRDRR